MTVEPLRLTDDEVLALAVSAGSPWPGGVPTVSGEAAEMTQAVFRGRRSLTVRGLIHTDGSLDDEVLRLCGEIPGAPAYLAVYLADDPLTPAGWGTASMHYPTTAGWVLETVNPMGIHQFAVQALDVHTSYLAAFFAAAERDGPSSASAAGPTWLCALAVRDDGGLLATARRGQLGHQQAERADGALRPVGIPVPARPEVVAGLLFAHLGGTAP